VSLAPLLRGDGGRGAAVVAEYLAEGVVAPMVMVREGDAKLIRCPGIRSSCSTWPTIRPS
jgi:choline-sulfatase